MTQREEFEAWFKSTGVSEFQIVDGEKASLKEYSWFVWNAAKAQAVPEGWNRCSCRLPQIKSAGGAVNKLMAQQYKWCARCGERKESTQFDDNQCWWNEWCKSCKRTPIGQLPILGGHV